MSITADSNAKSAFRLWREAMDYSIEDAANAVGCKIGMAKYLDQGIGPNGEPCLPKAWTRMLMTAAFKGHTFKPWPM